MLSSSTTVLVFLLMGWAGPPQNLWPSLSSRVLVQPQDGLEAMHHMTSTPFLPATAKLQGHRIEYRSIGLVTTPAVDSALFYLLTAEEFPWNKTPLVYKNTRQMQVLGSGLCVTRLSTKVSCLRDPIRTAFRIYNNKNHQKTWEKRSVPSGSSRDRRVNKPETPRRDMRPGRPGQGRRWTI